MSPTNFDLGHIELSARDLVVSYGREVALRVPHLNLRGKIVAIIGHNGSGKSTFIKTVLGLLAPRRGNLTTSWIESGERVQLVAERHMAFSPENGAVFADMSVESYIKLWCRIKQGRADYYRREGARYIELLDIRPLLKKLGRELSKGQRRRVQSAVGFLTHPKLFLFDEPFDGLDIAQSNQLSSVMVDESRSMAMVISSHRMEVVERLADLIIVLDQGQIASCGTVDEVCSTLCGHSVVISSDNGSMIPLLPALRERFYSCLVNSVGAEVSITGVEVSIDMLEEFLALNRVDHVRVKPVRPSLVDAMHYHLKKLH